MFETLATTSAIAIGVAAFGVLSSRFRIVVPTNDVHIVQHGTKTAAYGKDQVGGNVYYHWPAWLPRIGVRVTSLPSAVFQLRLDNYPAYDKGRVPFILDVIAFFRIVNFSSASSRVIDMKDLGEQLDGILKGAMRAILASSEIEEILEGRSAFGERFTEAVDTQLTQWGVATVKCIELMDIRDAGESKVIANIMAKKKSLIERQSRVEVAENMRAAQVAEIEAKQAVEIRAREQEEAVGKRAADRDRAIGIQQQQAQQAVYQETATTNENEMAAKRVTTVMAAEIERDAKIVAAEQAKQVTIKQAEATRQQQILDAEGNLESQKMAAEAQRTVGEAQGAAQTAVLMAPVNSQIALAKEIGTNEGYQHYLISLKQIEAGQVVGQEAARALEKAGVKIIATTGTPMDGMKSVMDLMTPKGATQLGASLEALAQTPIGERVTSLFKGDSIDRH